MATYKIDPAHSDVMFKVKHLMISTITGVFKNLMPLSGLTKKILARLK